MRNAGLLCSALCIGVLFARDARAGDWPQILGPDRNGHAGNDERLFDQWPVDGPKVVWRGELGNGFAGPAIVDDEVYLFHRVGDNERLQRLDTDTGREVWKVDFEASYRGGINPDNGPRCVPLVQGPNVYLFGAAGDLHCVARRDGTKLWSRPTHVEFDADEGYFGAGSTPIATGKVLLVNVGSEKEAGIVAVSLDTGKTIWKKGGERASYSAPTSTSLDGMDYAIFVTRYNALAIEPTTGKLRFTFPFGKRGPTVNAATPLVFEDHLFVTAAYGVGCIMADLRQKTPKVVWSNDSTLSSQYNTPICSDDHLYGIHGREDVGRAELRCIAAKTGEVKWAKPDFGVAHLLLADRKLLILKIDGTLLLADRNPSRFAQMATARVCNATTRALPALSNGRLYLRDNGRTDGSIVCLQVGPAVREE